MSQSLNFYIGTNGEAAEILSALYKLMRDRKLKTPSQVLRQLIREAVKGEA